jgi:hypothetical protein
MGTSKLLACNSPVQLNGSKGSMDDSAKASIVSAANDMINLSQALLHLVIKAPSNLELVRSIKVIHSQLRDLVFSVTMASEGSHFPEKESSTPISILGRRQLCKWG